MNKRSIKTEKLFFFIFQLTAKKYIFNIHTNTILSTHTLIKGKKCDRIFEAKDHKINRNNKSSD